MTNRPLRRQRIHVTLASLCCFAFLVAQLHADPPVASPERQVEKAVHPFESLRTASSHVVTGTVSKVYTSVSSVGDWRITECVAEIDVSEVSKGKRISVFDHVLVKYFYKDWIGKEPMPEGHWTGQRGRKVGSSVQVSLNGSGSGAYHVCMPDGFKIPVVQGPQEKWLADKTENRARLIVNDYVFPGDNKTTYELKIGDRLFSGGRTFSHNHVSGHKSSKGTLASIIKEMTGAAPEAPGEHQTLASILPFIEKNGWVIDRDTTQANDKHPMSTIRTIDFRRNNGGTTNR